MYRTNVVEKNLNTFSTRQLILENRAMDEIKWKNFVEPDRPQMTIKYGVCALPAGYLRL